MVLILLSTLGGGGDAEAALPAVMGVGPGGGGLVGGLKRAAGEGGYRCGAAARRWACGRPHGGGLGGAGSLGLGGRDLEEG